jgi:hypothetical protein
MRTLRATRGPWLGLLCAATLLLSACWPRLQVELASQEERLPTPHFLVTDPEHPERPLYNTIQVLDREGHVVWHLRAEPFGDKNSVSRFSYGDAPSGFEAVEEATPLQPNGRYALFVIGKNRGSLHFDVDAEGHVHAVEP